MKWASIFSPRSFRAKESAAAVAFLLWMGLSLVSLAAMYQLWWSRERVLYAGKSAEEQRTVVFERAGIPAQTLEMAKRADAAWPLDVAYDVDGPEVSLSYFKYLILPRIPSDSKEYRIEETDGNYILTRAEGAAPAHSLFQTVDPTARGLIQSALIMFAIAAGLSRFGFNLPEGMAGASLLLCAASVLLKPLFHAYAPVGIFMCALSVVGAWIVWKRNGKRDSLPDAVEMPLGKWEQVLRYLTLGVLAAAVLWSLLMAVVVVPDDWDAWAIWGPKAKVLLLGTGPLSDVKYFGHPDYPLLWPSVWAFSGWCAGGWEDQWGKAWGVLFLALAAWQVGDLSRRLSGRREAMWLVPALWISMPAVPLVASWGYAEAPLWLMLVCSFRRLVQWTSSGRMSDAVLAGLFAGAAALTKNEGALFSVLGLLWLASAKAAGKWRGACAYAATLAALYLPWLFWIKWGARLAPGRSLEMKARTIGLFLERSRESIVLVGRMWADIRQWNVVLVGALAMAIFFSVRKWRTIPKLLLIPVGMWIGTLAVIVMREGELGWQIGTAWSRLTLQAVVLLLPALAAGFGQTKSSDIRHSLDPSPSSGLLGSGNSSQPSVRPKSIFVQ